MDALRENSARRDTQWRVVYNQCIATDIYEMRLKTNDFTLWQDFMPGQFIHIRLPNAPELLLRRPISVHCIENNQIILQYAVVGTGTKALAKLKPEDELRAIGPIGQGFPVDSFKNVWLLGGGIGIAPLFTATQAMPTTKFRAFLGWRSQNTVYALERWHKHADVSPFTDDGSYGQKGFAIQGLVEALQTVEPSERPEAIFVCGPTPLLRTLSMAWQEQKITIPCYVSLEERMACGIGACLVCNCRILDEQGATHHRRVCVDGPVFPLKEVDFS